MSELIAANVTKRYTKKDDPEDMKTIEKINPILLKNELRLSDDYDIENVSENKEELVEFAFEYFTPDDDTYTLYTKDYRDEAEKTINDLESGRQAWRRSDHLHRHVTPP